MDTAKTKYELYSKICDRAEELEFRCERITLMMDLESADKKFNLRLEEMLNSDMIDFMHDIYGIEMNIVRDKFPATNFGCFVPRFAG